VFIKDLLDLPEQVSRGDFVLRLTEGVTRPDETLADYVVTKQLVGCFDAALGLIKSALEHRSSKAAYLHGSFGAGKSHFMAVLHLLLAGNAKARGIPELSEVVAKHAAWTEGKRILLVPYHLIGARNLESAILGNYAAYMRRTHPQARAPAVYRSEKLLENADSHRQALGDAKFFAQLNPRPGQAAPSDGWGSISAGWDAASYDAARNGAPESEERRRLVGDLVDSLFPAMRETNEFVDLDDGLAVLSAHAKALGYDVLVLFLDELILWLASHAANVDFVSQEAQKVPKLVESERADRPVPIVSFVARQRDLRELVGQHITGAERLSFSDVLSWWEGRFSTISLEDRNLPAIAEKRILKPKTPEARRKMDEEFARTAALREEVRKVLLTSHSNPEDFRKLYPFSPALVETLVAVSSLLQRERTALKIMVQLLVKQRDTLQLGQIVPVGDLYDEIAQGDEAFSTDMKAHFDNAHRLYQQHLRPLLEQEHSLTFDQAAELPWGEPRCRALRNDDRLVKTLLLAALAPEVESLKQMTPGRLAALNHGTITTPIPGQEAATVLNKCKKWAAAVGQIKIQEGAGGQPTITVQLSGVDTRRILDQAESVDNHGNRVRKLKDILLQQMGIPADQELYARHEFRWRGTNRECEVIFNNVRDLPDETLHTTGDGWRLIIDYPFDTLNHTAEEDSRRLERFRAEGKEARVICWVPSFFNRKAQQDLGLLVRLDYILTENRFPTFVAHLSEVDRAAARAQLQNQRDILCGQLVSQLEMAYGLRGGGTEYLDPGNSLDASEQFHSLAPSLVLRPPVASNFKEGLAGLLDQALTSQFPAHPVFEDDTLLSKGPLSRVLDVIRTAARDPNGVARVDPADRKHMLRVAVPMKLGDMGENRFQIGHFWKQHFNKRLAQDGQAPQGPKPLTVRRLRDWTDEPTPMGLPQAVQDLVILTFAEQTDRFLTLHGTPVEAEIGGLNDEAVLHETELPAQADWSAARDRAKHIFGVDCSPLLNAGNLASLAANIRGVIEQCRSGLLALPGRLETVKQQVWSALSACQRLDTANEAASLARQLEDARSEVDAIKRLAGAQLKAKPAVLGASLKSAGTVEQALLRCDWKVFNSIRGLSDDRKAEAERIWQDLEACFASDELAVALAPKFASLRDEAIDVLARTPPPPPRPLPPLPPIDQQPPLPPPPATPPALALKRLYKRSQVEGDALPDWLPEDAAIDLLRVHYLKPGLKEGGHGRENMMVVTPTLQALIQSDPGAVIDLDKGEMFLPKYGRKLKITVSPQHNG
jgi:hypothetical protein